MSHNCAGLALGKLGVSDQRLADLVGLRGE
jgi:hypothetical protein